MNSEHSVCTVHPVSIALHCTHKHTVAGIFSYRKKTLNAIRRACDLRDLVQSWPVCHTVQFSLFLSVYVFSMACDVLPRNVCNCNSNAWVQFMWQRDILCASGLVYARIASSFTCCCCFFHLLFRVRASVYVWFAYRHMSIASFIICQQKRLTSSSYTLQYTMSNQK